jgi:putative chitinase
MISAAVLRAAAPHADPTTWLPALQAAFDKWGLNTPRRVAAALGQFSVEAGDDFGEVVENLNYTHVLRICQVWPNEFPTPADATPYVANPEKLANRAYAERLGNGTEASGDGWRFRGRGLIQLTGRDEYTAFAGAQGMSVDDASAWCETPAGAAMSGCWYLATRGCLELADAWMIKSITLRVNGSAMLGLNDRIAASNAALAVMNVPMTGA